MLWKPWLKYSVVFPSATIQQRSCCQVHKQNACFSIKFINKMHAFHFFLKSILMWNSVYSQINVVYYIIWPTSQQRHLWPWPCTLPSCSHAPPENGDVVYSEALDLLSHRTLQWLLAPCSCESMVQIKNIVLMIFVKSCNKPLHLFDIMQH